MHLLAGRVLLSFYYIRTRYFIDNAIFNIHINIVNTYFTCCKYIRKYYLH